MAKGILGTTGSKLRMSKNLLSGALIEGAPKVPGTVQPMDALIPEVKGQPVVDPLTNFGSGKVTAPKGNAGIIRPTTKPKKG